jgi:hypothetical protein
MSLFKWAESRFRTFSVWDIGVFKLCVLSFAWLIAVLLPQVLALDWYWYAIVFAVTYIYLAARMLSKPKQS